MDLSSRFPSSFEMGVDALGRGLSEELVLCVAAVGSLERDEITQADYVAAVEAALVALLPKGWAVVAVDPDGVSFPVSVAVAA